MDNRCLLQCHHQSKGSFPRNNTLPEMHWQGILHYTTTWNDSGNYGKEELSSMHLTRPWKPALFPLRSRTTIRPQAKSVDIEVVQTYTNEKRWQKWACYRSEQNILWTVGQPSYKVHGQAWHYRPRKYLTNAHCILHTQDQEDRCELSSTADPKEFLLLKCLWVLQGVWTRKTNWSWRVCLSVCRCFFN